MEVGVSNTSTVSADVAHKPSRLYYILKRLFDIALSAIALVVLLPVFLVIAFCIKLDDGGDILYFREVIGQHGKRFFALKFRTMIPDADDYLEQHLDLKQHYLRNVKLIGDPRVTRVGRFLRKTSLDELPQLFNVLVGQMSLVGPRIIHPSELVRYGEFAQKLLAVKPAITGLWQISARQHLSYDERVVLDMRYIDTRSFFRELIIVFKTLRVFIIHTGD
jgi:lipopolysaccharide/colanic/teichoic acid biosynthesis glycosyltransferase